MVVQLIDRLGRTRLVKRYYWVCEACGALGKWVYRKPNVKVYKDGFCRTCDAVTRQHTEE